MDILRLDNNLKTSVQKASEHLKKGGMLVLPSDTVYGLCVDATNREAVEKLILFKRRPPGKAISVFIQSLNEAENYVVMDEKQKNLMNTLVPGPFTIILESKHLVSKLLESEKGTLGIRIIDNPFIFELLKEFKMPITATSANIGGESPHYSVDSLLNSLSQKKKDMIDLIIDAGTLPRNKPSTIIDITGDTIKMLRKGDLKLNDSKTFNSENPGETNKIAEFIFKKYKNETSEKPLVFLFMGDLGSGKTHMVKSMAHLMGIDTIISPTYVGYYEYENMYHLDLYNAQNEDDINQLHIENLLKKNSVLFIEWAEKGSQLLNLLKKEADVISISIEYTGEKTREITVGISML